MSQVLDIGVAIVGLGLVAVGTWWLSPAASLITVGGILIGVVVIGKMATSRE